MSGAREAYDVGRRETRRELEAYTWLRADREAYIRVARFQGNVHASSRSRRAYWLGVTRELREARGV